MKTLNKLLLTTGIVGNLLFSGCEENKKEVKITQDKEEALKKDIPAEYDTINKQVKSIRAHFLEHFQFFPSPFFSPTMIISN